MNPWPGWWLSLHWAPNPCSLQGPACPALLGTLPPDLVQGSPELRSWLPDLDMWPWPLLGSRPQHPAAAGISPCLLRGTEMYPCFADLAPPPLLPIPVLSWSTWSLHDLLDNSMGLGYLYRRIVSIIWFGFPRLPPCSASALSSPPGVAAPNRSQDWLILSRQPSIPPLPLALLSSLFSPSVDTFTTLLPPTQLKSCFNLSKTLCQKNTRGI